MIVGNPLLTGLHLLPYSSFVAGKIQRPGLTARNMTGGHPPLAVFLCPITWQSFFWVAVCGGLTPAGACLPVCQPAYVPPTRSSDLNGGGISNRDEKE
ncbi:hypothetical protein [Nitrosomonas nitrosa]|uniref:hypothetical protein n=1 Tax=Nitrosomonas nitrosa TaxID=52442 RepID=UPI00195DA07F|nr:hypothetical protein [Nitrosomonas nitrosa]